jgi:hypothetical protein
MMSPGRWRIGLLLVLLATVVRLLWVLRVPTIPVGDFAMYRESAIYLAEFGQFDGGFVYMPGLVLLLAGLHSAGGGVLAAKLLGVAFGGVAVGPLYLTVARLIDSGCAAGHATELGQGASEPWSWRAAPIALTAGLAYALWPAGIAMSSVIGTDIPTATMMLFALAALCAWGETRPVLAAVLFGGVMGLAAYFRAVALPLTALSAGYWLVRRVGLRATVLRTGIAIAATVVVLLPWGLRNQRLSGEFYLTDSHGGITALMGNDPNTYGQYSRSLGIMFHDLTGRTFLSQPHRQTDRAAYAIAKQWMAFDPAWTAGMVALRIERLVAPERGLLYWPVYRPGVLPESAAMWFNVHRPEITGAADIYYVVFLLGVVGGLAFAVAERRWGALVVVPFALALAGTYALFVAEPRYRLTSEVLLFPVAAFGVFRLSTVGVRGGRALLSKVAGLAGSPLLRSRFGMSVVERRGLIGTLIAVATVVVLSGAIVRGGAALRDRHRWAATLWRIDGQPQLALWRPHVDDGGPSPVRGAPNGARLDLSPGRHDVRAEVVLPNVAISAGRIQIAATIGWSAETEAGTTVTVRSASTGVAQTGVLRASARGPADGSAVNEPARAIVDHAGGPLRFDVQCARAASASSASVLISNVALATGATQ